jgi:hypothetical protein
MRRRRERLLALFVGLVQSHEVAKRYPKFDVKSVEAESIFQSRNK